MKAIKATDQRFDEHLESLKGKEEDRAMGRTLDQKIKSLPKARRAKVEERAAELLAEEATLQDLRKAFGPTQTKMAKK